MTGATRRLVGAACAAAATLALAPAASADPPSLDRPRINMERALLAAQVDPGRPGTGITRGAKGSVLRIERRLRRKGLLAKRFVDGHFGGSTRSAYSAWQRRLGFSGLSANGLPRETSLKRLAGARYRVVRVVTVGPRRNVGGHTLNRRTNRMKMAAANRLGNCKWAITQGSYNPGVSQSAHTHDGGGALDLNVARGCGTRPHAVRALRKVGFAAWFRPDNPGVWNAHIHAIAVGDTDLHPEAADQVSEYYRGGDGLAGSAPDNGPKVKKITWEQYKRQRN
jgi:hypothetical protein